MEISTAVHQDVAEPGAVVSGVAGTGQETTIGNNLSGRPGPGNQISQKRSRIVIGLGVLAPVTGAAVSRPDQPAQETAGESGEPDDPEEPVPGGECGTSRGNGDLIFSLFERQERIADRLNRKIERVSRRLEKIEERGRE